MELFSLLRTVSGLGLDVGIQTANRQVRSNVYSCPVIRNSKRLPTNLGRKSEMFWARVGAQAARTPWKYGHDEDGVYRSECYRDHLGAVRLRRIASCCELANQEGE